MTLRGKGINYDTGFAPGGKLTRTHFDAEVVQREMRVIADELHCTAARISGADPARISVAAQAAADAGLEVWFAPFPCEMTPEQMLPYFADCAERAEEVRRTGAEVVLVTGCELSLFATGFLPGDTCFDRIAALSSGDPRVYEAFASIPAKVNTFLAEAATTARARFGGRVTYASGMWEQIDWSPFDLVAVDAYRDKDNASHYLDELRAQFAHGKPVVVSEFGSCTYTGAGDRGGMGWAITEGGKINGDFVRDEAEQVRYLRELLDIFEQENVDSAFWFSFAGYHMPYDTDPHLDLDMASYGVVKMIDEVHWEPKESFHALAAAYGA